MSWAKRVWCITRAELGFASRRPVFWIWIALIVFVAFSLSTGGVRISSGDVTVGGKKALISSEFAQAQVFSLISLTIYAFFLAVLAGMSPIRDAEARVFELLHSTRLTPREYTWGKFLAVVLLGALALLVHIAAAALANHVVQPSSTTEHLGPFEPLAYLRAALLFGFPPLLFLASWSFAMGLALRRPVLVFLLPVLSLLLCGFFLWNWNPFWLSPAWDQALCWIDPSGHRWLKRTWLDVDRGVDFYNSSKVGLDAGFVLSRIALCGSGLLAVGLAGRMHARAVRGMTHGKAPSKLQRAVHQELAATLEPLGSLGMRVVRSSWLTQTLAVMRVELRELVHSPGLYLFVPLILIQVSGTSFAALGAFGTPALATSGTLASRQMDTLTLLVGLLLLFYTVESHRRAAACGLEAMLVSSPVRTSALFAGRTLANGLLGLTIGLAAFAASALVLLVQGAMPVELAPFGLVWGLLLLPSFLVWTSYLGFLWALTRDRYLCYALGLTTVALTGWFVLRGEGGWLANWPLWGVVRWSDMSVLELDRSALVLSRAFALALAVFFSCLTLRLYKRREADAAGSALRRRPKHLARAALVPALAALPALLLAGWLVQAARHGPDGRINEKLAKDTWKQNIETWRAAPRPQIEDASLDVDLDPERGALISNGRYRLVNREAQPLTRLALCTAPHWRDTKWSIDGLAREPRQMSLLAVFELEPPLASGQGLDLAWSFHGCLPDGISAAGGAASEFVLPGGVVLTGFSTSMAPMLGLPQGLGVDEDNQTEPREYGPQPQLGHTSAAFGPDLPFTLQTTVRVPLGWRGNGVGQLVAQREELGRAVFEWKSEQPVSFFNVVAGRWDELVGTGVRLYHHPAHAHNAPLMLAALEASLRRYSEWFAPFPWGELKLSEFPALAGYAQGFPTNITFSEAIGFLTRADDSANAPYWVTAHEAAHQWWGSILMPGDGPGGVVLAEGMAHFSTVLLLEAERGEQARIAFLDNLERRYTEERMVDSERPLAQLDGEREGDQTAIYDKGGWVGWMTLQHLGREPMLAALRDFIARWNGQSDHPLLQDYVDCLRTHAADPEAFDRFARQWYFEVHTPNYSLEDVRKERLEDGRWRVTGTARESGDGDMPITLTAWAGERFPTAAAIAEGGFVQAAEELSKKAACQRADLALELAPKSSEEFSLECDFDPERVELDADRLVLQLQRDQASHEFRPD